MKINEFANPRPVFKFTEIGDRLDGVIVEPPELQPDKFGDPGDKQLLLVIADGDREYRLYARRQMLGAIGDAVVAAEADEIDDGGHLRIEYTGRQTDRRRVVADEMLCGAICPTGTSRDRDHRRRRTPGPTRTWPAETQQKGPRIRKLAGPSHNNNERTSTSVSEDTRRYFQTCFGDTNGWLCVSVGRKPYRDENGKYKHHTWDEVAFRWPEQADDALTYIEKAAPLGDVYACPYLMKEPRRVERWCGTTRLWSTPTSTTTLTKQKVTELGGFIVNSGTAGHGHVYVPLAWPVTPAQHEALCRGLSATSRR